MNNTIKMMFKLLRPAAKISHLTAATGIIDVDSRRQQRKRKN